jgi:hypothetical protein
METYHYGRGESKRRDHSACKPSYGLGLDRVRVLETLPSRASIERAPKIVKRV